MGNVTEIMAEAMSESIYPDVEVYIPAVDLIPGYPEDEEWIYWVDQAIDVAWFIEDFHGNLMKRRKIFKGA
jgi:hypothetical protein